VAVELFRYVANVFASAEVEDTRKLDETGQEKERLHTVRY
jgi:hypothetical protein